MTIVYLNGEYLTSDRAAISVDDRGFVLGDGIYEGVRATRGRLFEWEAHAERMVNSLVGLRIELSADRVAALRGVCEQLVRDNGLADGDAFLYLAVTRGAAPRTHHFPPPGTRPTVFISATEVVPRHELRRTGARAITFEDMRWARCDWKTLNLLGSVLARQAAAEAGAYEAILVRDGVVTEGAASTVFAVIDGAVRSHPLTHRILPSVTRKVVMSCASELQIRVQETAVTLTELSHAQEIFLCGTLTNVLAVTTLDGAPVGGGAPGPIASRLAAALEARLLACR
jgi:D-alanine transaminase